MKKKIDIAKDSDSELIELRALKRGLELAGLELRHCLRCDKWWGGQGTNSRYNYYYVDINKLRALGISDLAISNIINDIYH